jgi:hypothetical protein
MAWWVIISRSWLGGLLFPGHGLVGYYFQVMACQVIKDIGAAVVMIVWLLDLQLPFQSLSVTTKVVSSNPGHDKMYLIQHYVIKFVSDLR